MNPTLDGANWRISPPVMTIHLTMVPGMPPRLRWLLPQGPSGSATIQSSDPPPAKGQAHAMEVDDEDGGPAPASPVSPGEDDLLTGSGAVGVEEEMANL